MLHRDFIFTNHRGSPLSITSINRNLQIGAKNVGIKKHITSHTMRHS
ncbi:tyrosine-type recombinase/integrase [Staphylococcus epidermidis]